jgi:hypothetical protein
VCQVRKVPKADFSDFLRQIKGNTRIMLRSRQALPLNPVRPRI